MIVKFVACVPLAVSGVKVAGRDAPLALWLVGLGSNFEVIDAVLLISESDRVSTMSAGAVLPYVASTNRA